MNELGNGTWDKDYQPSGISRAEERALEAYPEDVPFYVESRDNPGEFLPVDHNLQLRMGYINGYEQAEKDLQWEVNHTEEAYQNGYVAGLKERLTWQDIQRIVEIADRLCPYTTKEMAEFEHEFQSEEAYYREILKRFYNGKC